MIRTILLSAIIAAPAYADPRASWGASSSPDHNTSATLAPSDGPAVATITLRNQLTGGHDRITTARIDLPGLWADVTVDHGPGDVPDRITVTVPEGFIAVPPVLDVPEGESGVVSVYSSMGAGA